MSPIRDYPRVSDCKEPLVMVVIAFLEEVLHIEKTSILDVSFETAFETVFLSRYLPLSPDRDYAVTVSITPTDHLGDKLYLRVEYRAGGYLVSKLFFRPGWKPTKEQE